MNSNARRIFDSVVSIDAWHTSFSAADGSASVHVDVSFLKGKLGDDPDSPVRFEISLKRAEIVFIIPANEPIVVIQSSVKREPPISVQNTVLTSKERSRSISGTTSVDLQAANVNVSGAASGAIASKTIETSEASKSSGAITWGQSKTLEGAYRWELAPAASPILLGKAWEAVSEPLLRIKSLDGSRSKIQSVSRVEIRCRREDLQISNITVKNQNLLQNIKRKISDHRMVAVEAYIRNALADRNLDVRNFNDPYGEIKLADIIVDPQVL